MNASKTTTRVSVCALLICGMGSLTARSAMGAEVSFQPLFSNNYATFQVGGISADGTTVVGTSTSGTALRWTAGTGTVVLGEATSQTHFNAWGVSGDGSVVVGSSALWSSGKQTAFRWTSQSGLAGLPGDSYAGGSVAESVSADGSVIAGYGSASSNWTAFRWTAATGPQDLGVLPGFSGSFATVVSPDGSTIAGYAYDASGNQQLFQWRAATGMTAIGSSSALSVYPTAASGDGSVLVGYSYDRFTSNMKAYRWVNGTAFDLGKLRPTDTRVSVNGVSADGNIIVGSSGNSAGAFIWDPTHGMRSVQDVLTSLGADLTGWSRLDYAGAISADGLTLAGGGVLNGTSTGWVAHLPEPATLMMLALGVAGALRRRPNR